MKTIKLSIALFILVGVQHNVNAQNRKMESRVEAEPKVKEAEHVEVAPAKEPEIKAEPRAEIATPSQPVERVEYTPTKEAEVAKPVVNTTPDNNTTKRTPIATRKPMPVFQKGRPTVMKREALKPVVIDQTKK